MEKLLIRILAIGKGVLKTNFAKLSTVLKDVHRLVAEKVNAVVEDETRKLAPVEKILVNAGANFLEKQKEMLGIVHDKVLVRLQDQLIAMEGTFSSKPVLVILEYVALMVKT